MRVKLSYYDQTGDRGMWSKGQIALYLCFNPYKPTVLLVGHRQTVETQIRRGILVKSGFDTKTSYTKGLPVLH